MLCLYFIAIAFTVMFIYRQGLKDGQKVSNGEKIIDKPVIKTKSEREQAKEQKKFVKAINDRLEYGVKK